MIRLSELKLPLDASFDPPDTASPAPLAPPALWDLVVSTLGVPAAEIQHWQVFKRSFDARKSQLRVVYIVDVALTSPEAEARWLQAHAQRPHVQATPDMTWRPPVQAPAIAPGDAGFHAKIRLVRGKRIAVAVHDPAPARRDIGLAALCMCTGRSEHDVCCGTAPKKWPWHDVYSISGTGASGKRFRLVCRRPNGPR